MVKIFNSLCFFFANTTLLVSVSFILDDSLVPSSEAIKLPSETLSPILI